MKRKRAKLLLTVVALLTAAAVAAYYYLGWPDMRYLTADPGTRERLETEKLERGYRAAAKAFEQQLRTTLPKDAKIAAKIDAYNSIILSARQKYINLMEEMLKSANSFGAQHSRRSISMAELHIDPKSVFPDTKLMKEVRVDSVSDKPTSIHTDNEDLLQRYRADVNLTLSLVMVEGQGYPTQERFVATANPQKDWSFPSVDDVKQRILAGFDELSRTVENGIEMTLDKQKLELESMLHKLELEVLQRE
jgi:hypothetical protein